MLGIYLFIAYNYWSSIIDNIRRNIKGRDIGGEWRYIIIQREKLRNIDLDEEIGRDKIIHSKNINRDEDGKDNEKNW